MEHPDRLVEPDQRTQGAAHDDLAGGGRRVLDTLTSNPVIRKHVWPASVLALALLVILVRIASPGYPSGADTWGHLFKAEYLADQMRLHGLWAYVTTAWMPNWYLGDPFRTYYPPLTTLILTPVLYVFRDPILAYQIFVVLFLAAFAAGTYAVLSDMWGPWAGVLGGALALIAPYQLRTLIFEGNLPRMLAVLALPLLAWATEKILVGRQRKIPWVLISAAAWTWSLLAHPQQAYMFGISFGIYVGVRLFLDADVPLRNFLYWLTGPMLGVASSGPWLLPAYSHGELPNVPFLPLEKVSLFSAPVTALLPSWVTGAGAVSVGVGLMALAILAAISRPDPRRTAWLISGMLSLWLAFGPGGVLFSLVPLNSQLLPERFLNFTSFALPVAAAGIVPFQVRAKILRTSIVLGLVAFDFIPALAGIHNVPYPADQAAVASALSRVDGGPIPGRVLLMTYPEPSSQEVYFAGQTAPIVNGWALENTPQQDELRRYLSAPAWGPTYLQALLNQWNVQAVVLSGETADTAPAARALGSAGYRLGEQVGRYQIWARDEPAGYVQVLPQDRMLVVGRAVNPLLGAYPFAEESSRPQLSSLSQADLDPFPVLGIYRFEPSSNLTRSDVAKLQSYLDNGGTVVTDMSGMESQFGQTVDFFGVTILSLNLSDAIDLRWSGAASGLPGHLPLAGLAPDGWSGAAYQGLDGVLGTVAYQGKSFDILGYKDVDRGRIWFVGLNLLYYAQQSGVAELTDRLQAITLDGTSVDRSVSRAQVPLTSWQPSGTGLSLTYHAGQAVSQALLSYTYSPRFSASIDGQPVPLSDNDHLIQLSLPEGSHSLSIVYHPFGTVWPWAGLLLGVLAVLAGAGALMWENRTYLPPVAVPDSTQAPEQEYAPCSNCGFLLAEIGPPTPITYPFQVVHCPICGMQMDDEGFEPGQTLSEPDKQRRLEAWLADNDYDPTTVHERWGFARSQFFEARAEEVPPKIPEGDE